MTTPIKYAILKAVVFIACYWNTARGFAQQLIIEEAKGQVILDTTLNPEKYEARFLYIPEKRPIIRVRNLAKTQQVFVKIVSLIPENPNKGPIVVALSRRAYHQLTAKPTPQLVWIQFDLSQKLKQDLAHMPLAEPRVDTLNKLAEYLIGRQLPQGDSIAKQALQLSENLNYLHGQAVAHWLLSKVTNEEALTHLRNYVAIREKENLPQKKAWAYNYATIFLNNRGLYTKALVYGLKWLKLTQAYPKRWNQKHLKGRISNTYSRMVSSYLRQRQFEKTRLSFQQWLSFIQGQALEKRKVFDAYEFITRLLSGKKEAKWYEQQWANWIRTDGKELRSNYYVTLIDRHLQTDDYPSATHRLFQLLETQPVVGEQQWVLMLKRLRRHDMPDSLLVGFFRRSRGKVPEALFVKYLQDTHFFLGRTGDQHLRRKRLVAAQNSYTKLELLQPFNKTLTLSLWVLGGIAKSYEKYRYLNKAIEYHQKLRRLLVQQQVGEERIREADLYLSTLYRRNKDYLPGLEVIIKVTTQDQKIPTKHFLSLIAHMIEHGSNASQVKVKKRLKAWKSDLKVNDQQRAMQQIDHALEKIEESLEK